jgi:hypothetical protein
MEKQMIETVEPEIGRVRQMYLDFHDEGPYPRRGDEVYSGKTLYLVLTARQVKRQDPKPGVRVQMRVIRGEDTPEGLRDRLYNAALRGRGKSMQFSVNWHNRGKKRKTFEEYIKRPPVTHNTSGANTPSNNEVKVYAVNETEYVAASSELESAIEFASNMSHPLERCVAEGYIDMKNGYPRPLSDEEMLTTMFENEDDPDFGKPEYRPICFKKQLENLIARGVAFPCYFAGEV